MFHLSWTNRTSAFHDFCQPFGNSASNSLWSLLSSLFILYYFVLHGIYKEQIYKDGQYIQQKYSMDSMLRTKGWVFVGCSGESWFSWLRIIYSMLSYCSTIISKFILVGALNLELNLIKVYNESVSITTRLWVGFNCDSRKTFLFTSVPWLAVEPTQPPIQLELG